jgi:hypothetical protein
LLLEIKMLFPVPLLVRCGRALFGDRWQTPLAEALGVNDRTMRRWVSGDAAIRTGIGTDLHRLLLERNLEIDVLLEEMPRASAPEG